MERGATVVCAVLVGFYLVLGHVLADGSNDGKLVLLEDRVQDEDKQKAGFWIGPRLGRKKRTGQDDIYCAYVIEREPTPGGKQEGPWVILAVKKCKKSGDFIPRLGRESEEESWPENSTPHKERWVDEPDYDVMQRSPPFVPRLGRHILYSPRLGRTNE